MPIDDILNRLEAAERGFLERDILAPVLAGRPVGVRLTGVVCTLRVEGAPSGAASGGRLEGWYILRPLALDRARIVRPATLAEARAYLRLFPAARLIVVARDQRTWYALPASRGDSRLRIAQPVPLLLAEEGLQPFETVVMRFDGRLFYYEQRDSRRNPALAAYLRDALAVPTPPAGVRTAGLSAEERAAYAWAWDLLQEARRDRVAVRLSEALAHAGAHLRSFLDRDDVYAVTYSVGAERHTSIIRKSDLTVLTAGICLSGRDADFDLASLVGVLREAAGEGAIVRVGADLDEETYRRIYGPDEDESGD
jgi:hypothetical protein